jgi:hypothetical protein
MKKIIAVMGVAVVLGAAAGVIAFQTRPRWVVSYPGTRWVLLSTNPEARRVVIGSQSGGCADFDHVDLRERSDAVHLAVHNRVRTRRFGLFIGRHDANHYGCTADLRVDRTTVILKAPLGTRDVVGVGRCDPTDDESCRTLALYANPQE